MKKALGFLGAGLSASLAAVVGYVGLRLRLSRPRTSGALCLDCLESDVEVIFDNAGIPHIYADSDGDAFKALGYVMAQDRIVQMEAMLKVARGELAASVGKMALDMDRFLRTVGLARTARRVAGKLEPESRQCLGAFCEGINSYLSQPGRRLPFELIFLGGRPDAWTPADCLTLGLFTTWLLDAFWPMDLTRERLFRELGHERAMELLPETAEYNNPPVKVKGKGPKVEPVQPGEEIDWDFESEPGGGQWLRGIAGAALGSNNWALGGGLTDSGKPILASDPHIQHNVPSVLYMFHMATPDRDVIGSTFAGLPVIAYGHNGFCGWCATSLCPDTQDLYVETFESEDSTRYLYQGEWVEADVVEEVVEVRFSRPRTLRILITRHGPIIKRKGPKGLALKWVTHDTTTDSLAALLRQNRARSWDEFVAALEGFVGPAMNQVYADLEGNIGYVAAAKIPRRARGDGTIPYHGENGDCEWEGYIPFDRMPRAINPEEGFIVTANSKVVSEGYPELITRAWEAPYRNGRIGELIRSQESWSVGDMSQIHADTLTFPGRTFARRIAAADQGLKDGLSLAAKQAAEVLESWDYQARADSVAMTVYFYSWAQLREKLLRHRLGSTLFEEYIYTWSTGNLAIENLLEDEDPYWLPAGYESYDRVLLDALEEGVAKLEAVFGNRDLSSWKWGRIHHLTCQNLLGLFWPLTALLNVGPIPRDGEGDTVNAAPPSSDCLTQLLARGTMGGCVNMPILPDCDCHEAYGGPVMRMVLDFDDLDNSRAVLDVGQSGHRLSPHYRDHFDLWRKVEYFPLPYSRRKVIENAAGTLELSP